MQSENQCKYMQIPREAALESMNCNRISVNPMRKSQTCEFCKSFGNTECKNQ